MDTGYWAGVEMFSRIVVILGLIFLLASGVDAYRMPKPNKITKFDEGTLTQLNNALEQLWDITNGRYNLNIVTQNPDGNMNGNVGDMVLFNNSGTYYLTLNTTGAKVWRSVVLTDTP